jgi:hypothetical protein
MLISSLKIVVVVGVVVRTLKITSPARSSNCQLCQLASRRVFAFSKVHHQKFSLAIRVRIQGEVAGSLRR